MFKLLYSSLNLIIVLIGLAACAVGPDYKPLRPSQLNLPSSWHAALPHNGNNQQLLNWWAQFNDPVLTKFIQAAIINNPSLEDALAQIKQAQAETSRSKSQFYPTVTLTPSANLSNNGSASVNINGTPTPLLDSLSSGLSNSYSGNIYSSWEMDLFGANRRSLEAALAREAASNWNWNDVRVSLVSDLADNYVQYRVCQALVATYLAQLKSNSETLAITKLKIHYGRSARSDVNQADASYFSGLARLNQQTGQCNVLENKLRSLTGLNYAILDQQLQLESGQIPLPAQLKISAVPAATISQRPDVAIAERAVAAANADIGYAIAKRYPDLSLTGIVSYNPGSVAPPLSWSFSPSLLIPLTDGGYLKSQVALARAKYLQAVANYKDKVNKAVNEVEDALARINAADLQNLAQTQALNNYVSYFNIMNQKYQLGSISILELEVARANWLNAQTVFFAAQEEQARAWIALYKANGGSWTHACGTDRSGIPARASTSPHILSSESQL